MMHVVFKQETVQFHRRLNSMPDIRALVRPELNAEKYLKALRIFYEAYSVAEQALIPLEAQLNLGLLQRYSPRVPALIEDIVALGGAAPSPAARPHAIPAIAAETMSDYLGVRYVLDGTTQGGKYIIQRIRKNAPELVENAFAFWTVQQKAGAWWPLLREHVSLNAQSEECKRRMLDAADGAYRIFMACYNISAQKS